MEKEIVNQILKAQRVPGRIHPRRNTLRHTVITLTKIKDKVLKAPGKNDNIQGNFHKVISLFFNTESTSQKGMARYI